jgi:hypothetical protein
MLAGFFGAAPDPSLLDDPKIVKMNERRLIEWDKKVNISGHAARLAFPPSFLGRADEVTEQAA